MKHEMGSFERNVARIEPGYARDIEQRLGKIAEQYEARNPETVSWMRDNLARIDHKRLASVYQRIAGRGGELNRPVNVVPPERTFVVGRQQEIGEHSYTTRTNTFNGDHFKDLLQKHTPREAFAVLFDAICHENAHATGFVDIQKAERGDVCISAGYEDVFISGEKELTPHRLINEGISEIVGELAARMYLQEAPIKLEDGTPFTLEEYDRYVNEELMKGTALSISRDSLSAREFVYHLAEHVAGKTGISPRDIIEQLIRGYFQGGGFISELGLSLNESIGPDFVADLAGAKSRDDLVRLATKYKFPGLTPDAQGRMMEQLSAPAQGV